MLTASKLNTSGNALVISVMVALVMLISVMGITTSLTLGNRQTATNQGMANQAQYAAESGLTRSSGSLTEATNYLATLEIAITTANPATQIQQDLYSFCYGAQDGTNPAMSSFPVSSTATPSPSLATTVGGTTYVCSPSQVEPINTSQTAAQIAEERLMLLVRNIPLPYPGGTITTVDQAKAYWGNLAKGNGANWQVLGNANGLTTRFQVSQNFWPQGIQLDGTAYVLQIGSNQIVSTGQVVRTSDSSVVATRSVSQTLSATPLSFRVNAPSFAYFGYFYNSHRVAAGSNTVARIRKSFRNNGPTFTNGRYVFDTGGTGNATFGGFAGSAGCDDGATSAGVCSGSRTMNYYTGTSGSLSSLATQTPSFRGQWSGLGASITPGFTIEKNNLGQDMCYNSATPSASSTKTTCATGAADATKVRDIDWQANPIKMPGVEATTNFETRAKNGGFFIDANSIKYNYGGSTPVYFQVTGSVTAAAALANAQNPANYHSLVPISQIEDYIGKLTGAVAGYPAIKLDVVNGEQIVEFPSNLTNAMQYKVNGTCFGGSGGGGGGGTGGGTIGVEAPVLRPSLWTQIRQAADLVVSLATFSSPAYAQTLPPSCPTGQTRAYVAFYEYQQTGVNYKYKIASNGTISIVSQPSASDLTLRGRVMLNGSTIPLSVSKTPSKPAEVDLSKPFNGVIYSTFGTTNDQQWNPFTIVRGNNNNNPELAQYSKLTIASAKTLEVGHHLTYSCKAPADPTCQNILGLYAGENIKIEHNPSAAMTTGTNNMTIDGVLMAQNGSVQVADVCGSATRQGQFQVYGSVIQNRLGGINCGDASGNITKGYDSNYSYDTRMLNGTAPPEFPAAQGAGWSVSVSAPNSGSQRGFWKVVPGN
jgi:Tfp pilus assembly protein PilX